MLSYNHPVKTPLNRFDPRAKLVLLIGLIVVLFLPIHIIHFAAICFLIILTAVSFFGFRTGLKPLRALLVLFIFIGILSPVFYKSGTVLISFFDGFIKITDGGLLKTARLILRLASLSMLCYLYFISTELNQFLLTLRFFLLPFKAALIISSAVRYIPLLGSAHTQIKNSRKLTGSRQTGPLPVIAGLTIYAVKQIPVLAANLECRGIFRKNKRSSYFQLPPLKKLALDTGISLSIICLTILPVFFY